MDRSEKEASWFYRFLHSGITKIILGLVFLAGLVVIGQEALRLVMDKLGIGGEIKNLLVSICVSAIAIIVYIYLFRIYEKRKINELSVKCLGRNLLTGILLGAGLQSLTILVIYLAGAYSITSVNGFLFLIPSLTMAFNAAIFEELLFRGIIFRIAEEKLGTYIALGISAVIFGGLHLLNPNSSLIAGLGIAIQAGILLGVAYVLTRNLWLPIAVHFAWNFTQSGIFGASTSGREISKSLFSSVIDGPAVITGGQFGPEASLQATLICLAAAVLILSLCIRQGKIITPGWKKE